MAILHYNNDYVNSPAVDPNAFVSCPFGVPFRFVSFRFPIFPLLICLPFICCGFTLCVLPASSLSLSLLYALVVVDSFEDNL